MDCYKEFAHIYDQLINSDIDYKSFAEFILLTCKKYNISNSSYLDLACGTGNLTEIISKHFKYNFAVDISDEMLTEAESKMRCFSNRPKFICQDICELNLNRKFDLITCCLDAINYITDEEDLKDLFVKVSKHLNPQGIFIFDINSYYKIKEILGNNIFTYDSDEFFYVWENRFEDEIVDMFLTFFVKEGEMYHRIDEEHSERAYKTDFIIKVVNECGFEVLDIIDCYQNKTVTQNTERVTFVVKL